MRRLLRLERVIAMTSRDLVLPFAVMWVVSLVRVVTVVQGERHFGVVDTLAALSLLVLPWLLWRPCHARTTR